MNMKITFILPSYPRLAGGFKVVYEYANQLVARGHEVAVIHPRRLFDVDYSPPPNIYRWLRRKVGKLLRKIKSLRKAIFFNPKIDWQFIDPRVKMLYVPKPTAKYVPDADAIFATAWQTAEIVFQLPLCKGKRFYLIQDYETWGIPKERVDATWRLPIKKVIIAKWLYEKGVELGVGLDNMVYIPNGINQEFFCLERSIENRQKRVAMMFSSAERKGGMDGVKALELAKKEFPEFQSVLFGLEHRPKWLPKWIQYYCNPPQNVLVSEIYNENAIYICPSLTEGWGLPSAEAMACGCAVISTDNGGIRDFSIHGQTSLLSSPKNPEALANNLLSVLKNDSLRIQLAKAGHEQIKKYTWKRSTDLLEEVLLEAHKHKMN